MDLDIEELRRRLPPAKQIASDFYGVKWRYNRASCPRGENHEHGDRDPSFAYLPKVDRLQCFSQRCFGDKPVDAFDFVGQMEKCDFLTSARRLADRYGGGFVTRGPKGHSAHGPDKRISSRERLESEGWRQVDVYSMGDGLRKVRFEHPDRLQADKNRPEKTFLWEHHTDDGTWKPGRARRSHLAYVNSIFRERDQVESALGVESERSADTAGNLGLPAFSFKEITEENATAFEGLDVQLLRDQDEAGRRLVYQKVELLKPYARSIAVIEPPLDWPDAGDLHDAVVDMGWGPEQVKALLATANPADKKERQPGKKVMSRPVKIWTLASLRTAAFEPPQPIVEDVIAEGETIGLIGKPKAGKSRLVQQMALAVANGRSFLGHAVPRARLVLYLDLENRPAGVRTRFQKMSQPSAGDERLLIYAPETLSNLGITLSTPAGIKALQQLVGEVKPDLLIIDTWRLLLGGDENKTEVVMQALRALSSLRALRPALAILIVNHTRKTQGQDPPVLRIDPSAWVENASGHYSLVGHVDACFGLEREIDRKTGDELIVFGGVSRSAAPRTLLLDEDTDTLIFRMADGEDVLQKLLTEKEREAWHALEPVTQFTFGEAVERAHTKNRKLVASLLRKLTSMNIIERGPDKLYRRPVSKRN